MAIRNDKCYSLLRNTDKIRNICIMAHIDHGKTTLADYLIASNGLISSRLAGKLRYMDSRKDEQERGITMKSSSISLYHKKDDDEYVINLIDSPGHIDFSLEVSTATRLCDGALILIDVIEGICPQTTVALRHAWVEKIKPVLVLNKLDRMILETKMTPLDAYIRLSQILEQVNSIMGDLFRSAVLEKTENLQKEDEENIFSNWSSGLDEADDSNLYFLPEQGNVIFASAFHGWGFTIDNFTEIFSKKLGFSKNVLRKTLWGNYYISMKTKRVMKGAQENIKKPLFVQLILENIWLMYDTVIVKQDKEKTTQIIKSLNVEVNPQLLLFKDAFSTLRGIFGSWLNLSECILNIICDQLPSPNHLSDEKIENLIGSSTKYSTVSDETLALKPWFRRCSSENEAPIIIFISKMFPFEKKYLPENKVKPLTIEEIKARRERVRQKQLLKEQQQETINTTKFENTEEIQSNVVENVDEVLVAFARIYSGCIRVGAEIYVLGPKHDPKIAIEKVKSGYEIDPSVTLKDLKSDEHITKVRIKRLYLLMGRELEPTNEVPAGNVFGIGGLEEHVLKSATLSTEIACPAFSALHVVATPILQVAVEPENPSDLGRLVRGLRLLDHADPSVRVCIEERGEYILATTGEVHLQRCIEDLRERYAKVPIIMSEPIVPFRETIVHPPKVDMVNEEIKQVVKINDDESTVTVYTTNNSCFIKIKAVPLPTKTIQLLQENVDLIKFLTTSAFTDVNNDNLAASVKACHTFRFRHLQPDIIQTVLNFKTKLNESLKSSSTQITLQAETVWNFGPKSCGPNILFNEIEKNECKMSFWNRLNVENIYTKYESNFLNGFQLATLAGPLCNEPMMGVGFVVTDWNIITEELQNYSTASTYGPFSGQLIYSVKEACHRAFQMQPQRLMTAMYSCDIVVNTEALGRMYAVLNKRHGRIVHGDLSSCSEATFKIIAFLPVGESFLFASEVRKQTSGLANPQLVFSHWEVIDMDPFWKPNTEEEYLLYGEKADSENYARAYMNAVRKRKGLLTDEKVVECAEKQRTLSKNK
ncbi:hypothetical protein PGB90_003013 [Kerria lacca]